MTGRRQDHTLHPGTFQLAAHLPAGCSLSSWLLTFQLASHLPAHADGERVQRGAMGCQRLQRGVCDGGACHVDLGQIRAALAGQGGREGRVGRRRQLKG